MTPDETPVNTPEEPQAAPAGDERLEGGSYEILRKRLVACSNDLGARLDKLNGERKKVFGAIETRLLASLRISTDNNCVPRDIVRVAGKLLFGYNVFVGLRKETRLEDVFAVYEYTDQGFESQPIDLIDDATFRSDLRNLYQYYRHTVFAKFAIIGPHLFMVFRVGKDVTDIKTFKWLIRPDRLEYLDSRSDHEFRFPDQHEFEWKKVTHDMHRRGVHPHVSIDDRCFVETVGGDLTIKIEDNTETGEGIYSEPVDNADQTLDDAEIEYATVGNLVLMRIKPYQERNFRYLVYNAKTAQAMRIDSLADAAVLLPDGHGIIFPKGYYLQSGERKTFDNDMSDMLFEKRISSPNGEDYLYVFYNRHSGTYVLLSYNLIEQRVDTPVVCSGYCLRDDGLLIYFRADEQPQKHHAVQVWRTPFVGPDYSVPVTHDSYLYKVGNRDIVRAMAECNELLVLIAKEESYAGLYVDVAKKAQDIRDAYFWIAQEETFNLAEPLSGIQATATSAIEEYEKVVRTRKETAARIDQAADEAREVVGAIHRADFRKIDDYVALLADLRATRGRIITLRDLRYADQERIDQLEQSMVEHTGKLSARCVEFLLEPDALASYESRVDEHHKAIDKVEKVAEAKELSEQVSRTGSELEMLTEIVSNLKIDDATKTTAIIDAISLVYSRLNKVKSALKNRLGELAQTEGAAEFASQMKLVDQAATNYIDLCDTPEKCDEHLSRLMAQMESLEAKFADFEQFVVELAEKREQLYNAFESRKAQLVEQRNRRASALLTAGERILKGIRNRAAAMTEIDEIHGYFASNLMVERLRETISQLEDLGDTVKAEDLTSQLQSIQQEAIRQLKDRKGLYEDGENIIRLGQHRFSVNRRTLELAIIYRQDGLFLHLAGTGYLEPISDEQLLACSDVWSLETVAESPEVYRAEYLAFQMLRELTAGPTEKLEAAAELDGQALREKVQAFMAPRYAEGYVKGVHDADGAQILQAVLGMRARIGLLRYAPADRALALLADTCLRDDADFRHLRMEIAGLGCMRDVLDFSGQQSDYIAATEARLRRFCDGRELVAGASIPLAAEYLFHELSAGGAWVLSGAAAGLIKRFKGYLSQRGRKTQTAQALEQLADQPLRRFGLLCKWLHAFADSRDSMDAEYVPEAAGGLLEEETQRNTVAADLEAELDGLVGSHDRILSGKLKINYNDFIRRLDHHARVVVPMFETFQQRKKDLLAAEARTMRLDEFKPRILTTFVRNKLIDRVYLPLLGDNLAKQIGAAGDSKRTDRQGLLLLISPPGYGKTTLMEYISNRLGLTFMKINGPAIGHRVTSLDPAEAPNAAAREELQKVNLAFEMGDNVMIYLDDIQHTNPELLQKFISLCDAQRRVEGVYKGKTRTYDLRGKRVCVVMAGNPYTESGEKFRIPDMLSNRADTYNIGDIVGDNYDAFIDSYIENCLTSNPVLSRLAQGSQDDVYAVMKLAAGASPDTVEFQGAYGPDELSEFVSVMKKLFVVREVVLKVNQQYISSAGQSDEYRTEPPFLLQGSYRNMNRIASRVVAVMNDTELWTLINSAYEQDAQTLTTGAESNLLKFRELTGQMTEDQSSRWEEIKKTFNRNQLLGDSSDRMGQLMGQLSSFSERLDGIRGALSGGSASQQLAGKLDKIAAALGNSSDRDTARLSEDLRSAGQPVLEKLNEMILAIRDQAQLTQETAKRHEALTINDSAQTLVAVLEEQFRTIETWLKPVTQTDEGRQAYMKDLLSRFRQMADGYEHLIQVLNQKMPPEGLDSQAQPD
jgi:hypothetical protein